MAGGLRVALCQINTTVGDLDGNVGRILGALAKAESDGAELAVFPELAVTGYPPEDLLLKSGFVLAGRRALDQMAASVRGCAALVGFVDSDESGNIFNAAAMCRDGVVEGTYRKRCLPNYSVFDEQRYFTPGEGPPAVFEVGGVRVAVAICEDVWWAHGPVAALAGAGVELVAVLNASPYFAGRLAERQRILADRSAEARAPIVFVNQVGGQDELVFDGGSMAVSIDGHVRRQAAQFKEEVLLVDLAELMTNPHATGQLSVPETGQKVGQFAAAEVYDALVLGTRDYVRKNGFTDVVLGLSGGIDSSLVACVAADAIGADKVHLIAMPSRFTDDQSNRLAAELAAGLGAPIDSMTIEPAYTAALELLDPLFERRAEDAAEENLQGRIRAALLWALSNKLGWMVLVCGNKSELAVGYTTAYGVDMAGGFAPIKDVWKTEIYDLARERNRRAGYALIPEGVLTRPPTAELRPNQRDDDTLPAYDVLDPILEGFVEHDLTADELISAGHDATTVDWVTGLVAQSEWKRRQAPPGPRVSPKAFGRDRRMPITNHYRG